MEPSKAPKDVLGLGRHLVRELGIEDRNNTLGRWMAHYLAELIDTSENGSTAEDRIQAQARATETILKIWEHRTSLPRNAYPLARYADILQVLQRLRPDDNPWAYLHPDSQARREHLAASLFDRLTRLIIVLLWSRMPADIGDEAAEAAAVDALSETEQHVLRSLETWYEFFQTTQENSGRTQTSKKQSKEPEKTLDAMAVELIDGIGITLTKLRNELEGRSTDADE